MPSEVPFLLCYSGKKKDETGHMREQDFKSVAIAAAQQAGKIIADAYRTDFRVDYKQGTITNLVTEVDHRSEAAIAEVLTRAFPGHRILAEEGGEGLVRKSPYRWIVDPLDGTTNFAHGFPAFCVSIGLELEGRIILGVVYDPLHRELFEAQLGGGAFLNGVPLRGGPAAVTAGFSPGPAAGILIGHNRYARWSGEIRYLFEERSPRLTASGASASFSGQAHALHYDVVFKP